MKINLNVFKKAIVSVTLLGCMLLFVNPAHAYTRDTGAPTAGVFAFIQCSGYNYTAYTQNQANLPGTVQTIVVAYYGNGPRYDIKLLKNAGHDSWLSWIRSDTAPSTFNGKAFHHIQGTHNYWINGTSYTYTSSC